MRILVAFVLSLWAGQAAAASCGGRDLIADLKARDPAAYAAVEAEVAQVPNAEGLLWKIEGGAKPSYLFGTMHVADPRVTTLAPEVSTAFEQSGKIAVEVANLSAEEIGGKLVKAAVSDKGRSLDGLPEDVVPPLKAALQARGIPAEMAGMFEPWFLVAALSMPPCVMKDAAQRNPDATLDGSLIKKAHDAGKPVVGLETVDEQIAAFSGIDPELIRSGLIMATRFEPVVEDAFETLTQAYVRRQIAIVDASWQKTLGLTDKEAEDTTAFSRALTDARNAVMAERAQPLLREGGVFIAVGALHLPGELGLVELFRKQGLTVTRVW